MSRIGKRPIKLTQGVEVNFKERLLSVKGPKGELELRAHPAIELIIDTENISVLPSDLSAPITPMLGTTRALISNMIHGVTEGFQKQLNLVGVGYKAVVNQKNLVLNLGNTVYANYFFYQLTLFSIFFCHYFTIIPVLPVFRISGQLP